MSSTLMRPALWACAFIASFQQASTQPTLLEVGVKNIVNRADKLVRKESLKEVSNHHLKQTPETPLEGVDVIDPNAPTPAPGSDSGGVTLAPDSTAALANGTAAAAESVPAPTPAPASAATAAPVAAAAAAATTAPAAVGQSYEYATAVLASGAVVYYPMNQSFAAGGRCGGRQCQMGTVCTSLNTKVCAFGSACSHNGGMAFGDPCLVDASLMGVPTSVAGLITSCTTDMATQFSGTADEEIVLPDNSAINTKVDGYSARTVELWFQAASPGSLARTIYAEGTKSHSGLNLYVEEDTAGVHLWAYAWDRANGEVDFGTALVNPKPIGCIIQPDQPYYAAMVFDSPTHTFRTYISGASGVELCGETVDLPNGVIMKHHEDGGGGKPTLGGIEVSSRASALVNMTGTDHNFQGIIDEVAIYNKKLPLSELSRHYELAMR